MDFIYFRSRILFAGKMFVATDFWQHFFNIMKKNKPKKSQQLKPAEYFKVAGEYLIKLIKNC